MDDVADTAVEGGVLGGRTAATGAGACYVRSCIRSGMSSSGSHVDGADLGHTAESKHEKEQPAYSW
eukprot:1866405-Rhodomonas_salina.6